MHTNEKTGIRIEDDVSDTIIEDNTVYENSNYGIFIVGSNTRVTGNMVTDHGKHGIFLFADDNTTIASNNISSNENEGIRLQNSTDDTIQGNIIYQNLRYGLYVNYYSTHNLIYNNLFKGNDVNAKDISTNTSGNRWNISNTSGSNIIHGPYLGGNFWDDYTGVDVNLSLIHI